ncbi:MAG: PAS domain-containing protein [Candidatus Sericytochromatia bacterium]
MALNLGMHQVLFAQHPQPMWLLDAKTGTFLDVNPAALALYGYTREEFLALDINTLSAPGLTSCLLTPASTHYDALVFHRHRRGSLLSLQLKAAPVSAELDTVLLITLQDMTQYQQTRQALEHSEMRWQQLLENMGEGLWECNMRTGELILSCRWKALLGYGEDALTDGVASWEKLVHPDDLPRCQAAIQAHLTGFEGFFEIEHRLRTQAGNYRWFCSRAKIVDWTPQGEPAYMMGTLRDINDQKELEMSLKATEKRLQLAQQAAGIGIWDVDLRTRKVVWDGPTRDIFGVGPEADFEPSFRAWRERVHPDDLPQLLSRSFAELGQTPFHYEHRIVRPQGEVRFVETHGQVIWNAQGEAIRMLGMCLDITARKEAEALQIENHERLELARSTGLMGIWDMDLASGQSIWDARTREILGVPQDLEATFEQFKALVHPEDVPLLFDTAPADYGHEPFHLEHRIVRPDGEIRYIENHGRVLWNAAGEAYRMLGLNIDITSRKLADAELQRSQEALQKSHAQLEVLVTQLHELATEAQNANQAKNTFITNMSHEIRTPLNGMLGMAELLLASENPQEQRGCVEIIRQSGEALLDLVNNILDFAKMEAHKLELRHENFDLHALLKQTTQILGLSACQKGLELLPVLELGLSGKLVGDATRLRQVLFNLGSNAIKFTEQGQVELHIRRLGETPEQVRLRFEVVDSGIGIAPEQAQAIFEPFVQGDNSLTRKYGGAGLGLAISRSITAAMGGELTLRSQVGGGSCFSFEISLDKQPPAQSLALRSVPGRPAQAMIVHTPNALLRQHLCTRLQRWGCQVLPAKELDKGPPHAPPRLVIWDWPAGAPSPGPALQALHAQGENILLLAYPLQEQQLSAAERACLGDWVAKPLHDAELWHALLRKENAPSHVPSSDKRVAAPEKNALRILLAEDNPINQAVAQAMIGRMGHQLDIVENGVQALQALHQQAYDLVLMDCQMPEMDGYEATRQIRKSRRGQQIPIIALTAHAMESARAECLEAGMNDYLSKPFHFEQLEAIITRWQAPAQILRQVS